MLSNLYIPISNSYLIEYIYILILLEYLCGNTYSQYPMSCFSTEFPIDFQKLLEIVLSASQGWGEPSIWLWEDAAGP